VVENAKLRQVFSEYFSFPCQAFHRFLQSSYINWGCYNRPAVASVIVDLVPLHPKGGKKDNETEE
jgi:hypothetical protein